MTRSIELGHYRNNIVVKAILENVPVLLSKLVTV